MAKQSEAERASHAVTTREHGAASEAVRAMTDRAAAALLEKGVDLEQLERLEQERLDEEHIRTRRIEKMTELRASVAQRKERLRTQIEESQRWLEEMALLKARDPATLDKVIARLEAEALPESAELHTDASDSEAHPTIAPAPDSGVVPTGVHTPRPATRPSGLRPPVEYPPRLALSPSRDEVLRGCIEVKRRGMKHRLDGVLSPGGPVIVCDSTGTVQGGSCMRPMSPMKHLQQGGARPHTVAATDIQRVARGHIARCLLRKFKEVTAMRSRLNI